MFDVQNPSIQRPSRLRPIIALVALIGLLSGCIVVPAYGPAPPRYYGHYWR